MDGGRSQSHAMNILRIAASHNLPLDYTHLSDDCGANLGIVGPAIRASFCFVGGVRQVGVNLTFFRLAQIVHGQGVCDTHIVWYPTMVFRHTTFTDDKIINWFSVEKKSLSLNTSTFLLNCSILIYKIWSSDTGQNKLTCVPGRIPMF